jgi:hypothetical protein
MKEKRWIKNIWAMQELKLISLKWKQNVASTVGNVEKDTPKSLTESRDRK